MLGMAFPLQARGPAHDKHQKIAQEHVALGKVINNHGKQPIEGAVVYLEDPKSLAIRSYLTHADGGFHFRNLTPQTDYEIWAELNGEQSKHLWISQFSNHAHFTFTLKLDPKDGKKKVLGIL